ncbi:MAG: VOC family protein [Agriterribacter sp.]
MQKIIPHLWFDTQAKEAAAFYSSILLQSTVMGSC